MPPGWVAPGPKGTDRDVPLGPLEEVSWLLGDWRIVQRRDGHRWSLDDFLTAWVARETMAARPPRTILDLGTGIGSVALMLGWCFPEARVTGVEAQALSHGLSLKSIAANGVEDRFTMLHGDLRDFGRDPIGPWDLVTGTPPYFDDPGQTRSTAVQKAPCRFEERGGAVDYARAMARTLAADGRAVLCHASRQRERVREAIADAGLVVIDALEAVPKVDRDPLVDVFVLAHPSPTSATPEPTVWRRLTVRDARDQWTPEFLAVRLAMGMPPRPA